jgi:hypothetical protein
MLNCVDHLPRMPGETEAGRGRSSSQKFITLATSFGPRVTYNVHTQKSLFPGNLDARAITVSCSAYHSVIER